MGFSTRINTRLFKKAMQTAPRRLSKEVARGMQQHALAFDAHLKRTVFGSGPGGKLWRTGKLARSVGSVGPAPRARVQDLRMLIFIGQGVSSRYARTLEYGGVIVPRTKRFLTVPLPDNLTPGNRVARYPSAAELRAGGRTFLTKSKAGNLVIGLRGDDERVQWLWILKKRVKIAPQLGFRKAFRSAPMRRDRIQRVNAAVRRALAPAAGGGSA